MSISTKAVEQLNEEDLEALLASSISESRNLDYKRDPIGRSDRDRYEFLADVSSFANAGGGDLLIGIAESEGVPTEIPGLELVNADQEILRLEQIVRTGIRPAIGGIVTRAIPIRNGRHVLLMRVPKSWAGPHQIGQQGSFRFFGRSSNGKFQLDVDELRSAFRQGPELAERVRLYRADRLGKIISENSPVALRDKSKIIVHIVPLNNFATRTPMDVTSVHRKRNLLSSFLYGGGTSRLNLDGVLSFVYSSDSQALG